MVFYECVITAKHGAAFHQLGTSMKKLCHEIVNGGGIVRSVQNHGIRDLPHRFKTKYSDAEGIRYHKKGRFISVYYDSNPYTMRRAEIVLSQDTQVLRFTHLRARSQLDFVNISQEDKNPYLRKVIEMEEREKQEQQQDEQLEEK